jgi:hypothetical protein
MATHWEYKLKPLSPDMGTPVEMRSDEDAEGWEPVTAVETEADDGGRLVFRRELSNPTWDQQGD